MLDKYSYESYYIAIDALVRVLILIVGTFILVLKSVLVNSQIRKLGGKSLTEYGKTIKKRLIDIDKNQAWLIERITEKTGLFMDNGYMQKILSGQRMPTKIVNAINEILDLKA